MIETTLKCPKCGNTEPTEFRVEAVVPFYVDDGWNLELVDLNGPGLAELNDNEAIMCIADDCDHTGKPDDFIQVENAADEEDPNKGLLEINVAVLRKYD